MSPTVYRFYAEDGELLYVGFSMYIANRMGQHGTRSTWWPNVAAATFQHFGSRGEALAAEKAAIEAEKPRYNIATREFRNALSARLSQARLDREDAA